ncbi:Transcriptional regulator AcuR [Methylobacterium cerastii]|uniref:Transcriptional regulator AcuR n=1 Tax=Methylobacterium cerastii TaxID=932741 RepID=A0ABQ4QG60_9HYPH|nr:MULTISPECIES: TetR/AcrR family transcriptional regulator [Methylobacterium]TXM95696.1 TetR/AcrR family transcriptional regulator [Methylobacterium sp. WL122]TXM65806.1 TetR/AcrR family transcriptional regulator [Methylobacterium sp. WL120]TXM67473.1 TetR/AcrR family transcriptional regulator [Methylobacterium sp. WL12]TXM98638.1 TetR/AcrR family transcriptional regulator [Methylobacterium sp. WL103]TXN78881.1 TetR/AcrR family transcriptional regulator [Methylobacterium sp. WL8]
MRDTRTELLIQAETLVRGRGWSGFSYADLAEAVGIRKASIHHHFRTKDDLGAALVAAYGERYDAALAEILSAHPAGIDRIAAYGRLYLGGVEQGLGCLCAALATEGDALPERLRADVVAFFARHVSWLEQVFRDGAADGSIRPDLDPATHARLVVATLEGALLLERLLGGPDAFAGTLTALTERLR